MRFGRPVLWLFVLAAAFAPQSGSAYPRDDAVVVEVEIFTRADIDRLNDLGMDIMTVREGVAQIAAVPSEVEILRANGFRPVIVLERTRDAVSSLKLPDRGEYHSYEEMTADLAAWAGAYPDIARLVSIGQSFEGRELWALVITDNPDTEEPEPEIQWIGGHHGDETISVEVPYYMADYLLSNYGTDPRVTWLVDEREIWVIPMFNPDGHAAGTRNNAQGINLNRDFLCPNGQNADTAFSAPETRALRDFNLGMRPVTSLTFHAGALYVNYLWDYTSVPTPDEPMIITLSNVYSSYSGYPIINGWDWYPVYGSCQDWCYHTRGEIDWTIELSVVKDPPASKIDLIFEENREAMLYLAGRSGRGIRGLVTDAMTGAPVSATISIPEIGRDVYTDPDVGDYHRMVEAGSYTVVCSAEGYATQMIENVSAGPDTFVVVDFEMESQAAGTLAVNLAIENFPNPFGPSTSVRYSTPAPGPVDVRVYDLAGRLVRTLVDGAFRPAGPHEVKWDGVTDGGSSVGAGVYFVRVESHGSVAATKMVLLE